MSPQPKLTPSARRLRDVLRREGEARTHQPPEVIDAVRLDTMRAEVARHYAPLYEAIQAKIPSEWDEADIADVIVQLFVSGIRPTSIARVLGIEYLDIISYLSTPYAQEVLEVYKQNRAMELEALGTLAIKRTEEALLGADVEQHKWATRQIFQATGILSRPEEQRPGNETLATELARALANALEAGRVRSLDRQPRAITQDAEYTDVTEVPNKAPEPDEPSKRDTRPLTYERGRLTK